MLKPIILDEKYRPSSTHDPDVLLYYDGPLLFWLKVPNRNMLAIAVVEFLSHYPLFIVEVSDAIRQRFEAGDLDLHDTVYMGKNHFHVQDYYTNNPVMEPIDITTVPDNWIPERNYFPFRLCSPT